MSNKIALIIPTRGRRDNMIRLIESWKRTTQGKSDIIMVMDEDDIKTYNGLSEEERVIEAIIFGHRQDLCAKTNIFVSDLLKDHDILGSLGDDHVFLTPYWETKIIEWQDQFKGICYCNDLLQGENLPTNVFIHKEIIEPLGYMAPPILEHYFIDNYWKDLGLRLGNMHYFPEVIIEHKHWSNGKSEKDATYTDVENKFEKDRKVWDNYRITELANDVKKIQDAKLQLKGG